MVVELYAINMSVPSRLVMITAEVLGVKYTFHKINLMTGDHKKPEFLKINPRGKVPALKDGDLVMNEGRAIACYLANAYPKDDKLYPKDPKIRAKIDMMLYIDMGTLFAAWVDIFNMKAFRGVEPPEAAYQKLKDAYAVCEDYVSETGYMAGTEYMTLADLAILTTYGTAADCKFVDLEPYPKMRAWYEKVKAQIPNFDTAYAEGAKAWMDVFGEKVGAAKK